MTVCAPNSAKWPAIVEALHHYDTDGQIFKSAEIINNPGEKGGLFSNSFHDPGAKLFLEKFAPELILDQNLPAKLKLLPIEREAFYILHFEYYLQNQLGYGSPFPITNALQIVAQSIFRNKTQQEIGEEVKEHVC